MAPATASAEDKRAANRLAQRKFRRQHKNYVAQLEKELELARAGAGEQFRHHAREIQRLRGQQVQLRNLLDHVVVTLRKITEGSGTEGAGEAEGSVDTETSTGMSVDSCNGSYQRPEDWALVNGVEGAKGSETPWAQIPQFLDWFQATACPQPQQPFVPNNGPAGFNGVAGNGTAPQAPMPQQPVTLGNELSIQETTAGLTPLMVSIQALDGVPNPTEADLTRLWELPHSPTDPGAEPHHPHHSQNVVNGIPDLNNLVPAPPVRSFGSIPMDRATFMPYIFFRKVNDFLNTYLTPDNLTQQPLETLESDIAGQLAEIAVGIMEPFLRTLQITSFSMYRGSVYVLWHLAKAEWAMPRLVKIPMLMTKSWKGGASDLFQETRPYWLRPTNLQKSRE
jgi:hypothetical protein